MRIGTRAQIQLPDPTAAIDPTTAKAIARYSLRSNQWRFDITVSGYGWWIAVIHNGDALVAVRLGIAFPLM